MNGFTQGGYRLVYNDKPPSWEKQAANPRFGVSFADSIGFSVMQDGVLGSVEWNSPAFKAGLVPGMDLLAVNGETYSSDKLKQAILEAEKETTPINLLMKDRDQIKAVTVDYHGGMRYPHLERVEGNARSAGRDSEAGGVSRAFPELYRSVTLSRRSKNSGKEIAADSAPRMSVSPVARSPATENAIAMR